MSATSINSTSVPMNSSSSSSSNSGSSNVLPSTSNIVILENQILDSNDVVAAASLQQLSNAGTIKLTRDCAVQYSNLINSYAASSANSNANSSGSGSNNGGIVTNSNTQMSTVNIIPGDASQTSSRVQVLSNVQLVSKGGSQPSTFSYVDASGKNFNVLTSSGKISTNKLISVPITKVKTFNHIGQQQQPPQTQLVSSQMQQQHPVQKVTVPRSIQLVTRIPNSTISVSNGRVSQITPAMSQQQPQFAIQQYTDSGAGISSSSLDMKNSSQGPTTITTVSSNKGVSVKGKTTASLKLIQNATITHGPKTSVGKGMSVSLKSVRNNSKSALSGVNSQYFVKNSSNGSVQQQPGTTTSIYTTSPAQAVYHSPTPHPPQQPIPIPIGTVPASTNKGKNFYKTSKNQLIQLQQQQQQHQPAHQSPQRSVTPQSPSSVGLMNSNTSYGTSTTVIQGNTNVPHSASNRYQNYNSYSIPASQTQSSTNYKSLNHLYTGGSIPIGTYESPSSTVHNHEHPIPSVTVTGYTSSTGKGKKYGSIVNSESNTQSFTASPVKVKSVARGRNNSLASYQQSEAGSYQRYSASPSRQHQQQLSSSPHSGSAVQQTQLSAASAGRDDHLFINGQQMTDETSARILQSLSQKSTENSGGKYSNYKPQQQFTFYGSDSVPQLSSSVHAPFLPGSISGTSSSSSINTTPGIVYDPSDARFYEDKSDNRKTSISENITYSSDNIPLREGYPSHYNYNYREDDDQIGVEVRPAPVDTSNGKFHILQAVMQDHTYFAVLPDLKPPDIPTPIQSTALPNQQQLQQQQTIALPLPLHTLHSKRKSSSPAPVVIAASVAAPAVSVTVASAPVTTSIPSAAVPAPLTKMNLSALATVTSSSVACSVSPTTTVIQAGTDQPMIGSTVAGGTAGLDYIYQQRPQDDDANSVISTGSRNFNPMDNDLGEETETAPEGEGEDDSVTRCICDLTHDDGYMICCDKCSAWQHVDCMGIDRTNIPDEYNCEMCQPRAVDRSRARMLQMEKRKEQSLFLSNNNLQQMQVTDADVTSTNSTNVPVAVGAVVTSTASGKGANQYTTGKAIAGSKKSKTSSSSKKKAADGGSSAKKSSKKSVENPLSRVNGKRKELKKPSKKKVKTVEQNAEKMSNMIRTWIDNYERAITNHYSPELRARLQAFGKMQSHNPLLNLDRLIPASSVTNLMQKCTTVPHAGGKILISTGDIEPKTPIIEIRGKYMISSQHKQLQSLFNMAANGKLGNNKNAGPFLFLYQLTNGGMELCVDTRTYGNDARFVRRSCRPNAEILHNVDKGVVHLYIVSTVNIKANTEITIKHDEHLIQRVGGVVILTHTTVTNICACGLIKECQYSAQLTEGILPTTSGTTSTGPAGSSIVGGVTQAAITAQGLGSVANATTTTKTTKNKKNNGVLGESTEKKPAKKRNSRSTSSNVESRLRSISSSGDSSHEMMLYAQQQSSALQQPFSVQQNPHSTWNQQLQQLQQQSRLPHPTTTAGNFNLALSTVTPQQQMAPEQLVPHNITPQHSQPISDEALLSPSGQFQHQLHHWQQHQDLENLTSVHNQSAINQQQVHQSALNQPQAHQSAQNNQEQAHQLAQNNQEQSHQSILSQTPPPSSPVIVPNNRPGFYMEIKSPMNSPPLCLRGPPLLVVPTVHSPVKSVHHHPLQSTVVTKLSTFENHQPMHEVVQSPPILVNKIEYPPAEEQSRLELIHQQQQLHQQHIMEDILKIKIKSPSASPIKQEPSLSPSASSMLSPPPPPPVPVAQRLCAETLKNELFHSHFSQQQQQQPANIQSVSQTLATATLKAGTSPQNQQPTLLKSPVKLEYPIPSMVAEVKQEVFAEQDSSHEMKAENQIKSEPIHVALPSQPSEDPTQMVIKKEETQLPDSPIKECPATPEPDDIKKEEPLLRTSLCDSLPSSPVKNSISSPVAVAGHSSCNSSNSSPQVIQHHQQGGSSSKKKGGSSRDNSVSSAPPAKEEKKPSRKLTREERKMEAIVKAFEKMEQSQQRKQELKEQRKEGKRRSVSSSTPDECTPSGSSSTKKKSLSSQKRKKKKSKSLSQHFGSPNQSRKKKLSKSSKSSKKTSNTLPKQQGDRPHEDKAAELLLTFSQATEKSESSSFFGDDVKPLPTSEPKETLSTDNSTISNLPLLSSACMLVEAAVGPLEQTSSVTSAEQDFKFPHKAKTKKSMSREWLSGQVMDSNVSFRRVTPDQDSGYISEEKTHELRRTATAYDDAISTPLGVDVSDAATICIAAKKVEEFIAQNSPQSDEVSSGPKWDDKVASSSSSASLGGTVPEANQAPASCASGGVSESAAAKKRWLRQAISEETDELNQASSSPPPPNGFTTPLKKRRVIRQSDDAPQQQSNHIALQQQQQQQQHSPLLSAAQKIDFGGQPPQPQQQLMAILGQPGYSERSTYWSNAGQSPLSYAAHPSTTHLIAEEKHAIDLSRTASSRPHQQTRIHQPPRIAPYKIVPIAQALTPLHFTDPDPLPVSAPVITSASTMGMQPQQQEQRHCIAPALTTGFDPPTVPVIMQVPPSVVSVSYEPPSLVPPPSAVAAVVPASLMPPESILQPYQSAQQHSRIEVINRESETGQNEPSPTLAVAISTRSSIPRSKGSQKYIGSPAKFEPPSPAESQHSSVAETPEKNSLASSSCSGSVVNSDVDEEDSSTVVPISEYQPSQQVHNTVICAEPISTITEGEEEAACEQHSSDIPLPTSDDNEVTAVDSEISVIVTENALLMQDEQQEALVQEEIIDGEIVVEQSELELMDTNESTVVEDIAGSGATLEEGITQLNSEQHEKPVPPIEVDRRNAEKPEVVNGREKTRKAAPEEECEKNELEDLQKVIASFHSENIMTLISRNKKAKKAGRDGDDRPPRSGSRKQPKNKHISTHKGDIVQASVPESSQQPAVELATVIETEVSDQNKTIATTTTACSVVPTTSGVTTTMEENPTISTLARSYSHPSWSAAADNFRESIEMRMRPDIPQINYNSPTTYQSNAARNLLSSLSVGSEPLSTLGSYRPSTSSFLDYTKPSTGVTAGSSGAASVATCSGGSNSSIYQYRPSTEISSLLEKGFSGARPSSFLDDRSRIERTTSERLVTSSFLLSSSKVTDNLSTLGSTGSSYPKIFTKTASHDPRLNPALTTPEPAAPITPKRKLSINEYRQRKMQSSTPSTSASSSSDGSASSSSTSMSAITCVQSAATSSSNAISSSLGSNDVSSSISKELSLELELELNESEGEGSPVTTASSSNDCSSKATSSISVVTATAAEPGSSEQAGTV